MTEPYTPGLIQRLLRAMPDDDLRSIVPARFHAWPTRRIVPSRIIDELIQSERAQRGVRP